MVNNIKIILPYGTEISQYMSQFVGVCASSGMPNALIPEHPDDDCFSLVALNGDKVVGGLTCIVDFPDREAEVDALSVREDLRGKGVGCGLLEELESILIGRGITTLKTIPDRGTGSFYEGNGFSHANGEYMIQQL